jgi:AcrR family transcriptional regulator
MMSKSAEKRELILSKAEQVFIRRGFNGVTMKDIIEECNISRGGIYLYFNSVDEIFVEVIKRHNQIKLENAQSNVRENKDFETLIDNYFHIQKDRLLNMENSLLLAVFEFFIAYKHEPDKDFFSGTFDSVEKTIIEILNYGVEAGHIKQDSVRILAANILYCIKGLETQAMSFGVAEEQLDDQFSFYKALIFKNGGQSNEK